MIRKLYVLGHGGKHRDNEDARRWRDLTTELAANIRAQFPSMTRGISLVHADIEAEQVTRLLNRRTRREAGFAEH